MGKIQKKTENRCRYSAVVKMMVFTLFFTGLTGCKNKETQFLIDGFQKAQAQVEAEEAEKSKGQAFEDENNDPDADNDNGQSSQAEDDSEVPIQKKEIFVDVCGAVVNPGVFQLEEGSRVFQAIEAAGGYLPEAAQTCVNRAGILTDGQQLYILTQEEMAQQGVNPAELARETGSRQTESAEETGTAETEKININTADETLLTTLTGIGAARAQAIIAYREENGPFAAIEEIMNVQGIKEGTFAKIKDKIVVG